MPTVGLLNLMPKKAETEHDFCRMLAASGIPLNLVLLKIPGQQYKTTPQEYVDTHYVDFAPTYCENALRLESETSKNTDEKCLRILPNSTDTFQISSH